MAVISPQFIEPKKPWFKRQRFYLLAVVAVVIGWFAIRLSVIYNTIVIDNGSWLGNFASILKQEKPTPDPNPMPTPEPDRFDVLILGIRGTDQTAIEEEGGLLTDTLLIASVDKTTKKAALVSIPRDLYVDILGVKGKVNEIYERGLERKQGLELAKQIVSRFTGVYIDKTVVFDFNAFQHIVDTLGGIDIYLAKPFTEKNQWGYEFSLPAGNNHLNGEQALYYVRSRFSTSDFDRARRQQEVIAAIKDKAAKSNYLTNPVKITNLLSELKDDIRTDFQIWDIKDMLDLAATFSPKSQIKNYVLSIDNLLYETHSAKGDYLLLPKGDNYDMAKELFLTILEKE
ncbi:MAG: LCP family protein [Patescibacteria group bacterium]